MEEKELWPVVDFDFLKSFMILHNEIAINRKKEKEFDSFVISNKEKFNHPDYLRIFAQRVEVSASYFKRHQEVCTIFYNLMKEQPGWIKEDLDFGDFVKLGSFEDSFHDYLKLQNKNAN